MHLGSPLSLLALAAGAASAPAGHAAANVSTVFELDKNYTWFENLAVRSSGQILATRLDVPELWSVDPFAKTGARLLSVPGVESLLGITEVQPDVFAIVGMNYSFAAGIQPNSSHIWEVDLRRGKPVSRCAARLPRAVMLNGADTWSPTSILVADSMAPHILLVDLTAGSASVAISDPATMAIPANATHPLGPNGVKVFRSLWDRKTYVYYSSTGAGLLCRVPVDERTATPSGPVEVIARSVIIDDFVVLEDGSAVAATTNNTLARVTLDGRVATVAGSLDSLDLASVTACRFGRTWKDSRVLYATTAGGIESPVNGAIRPADVAAVDLGASWWW